MPKLSLTHLKRRHGNYMFGKGLVPFPEGTLNEYRETDDDGVIFFVIKFKCVSASAKDDGIFCFVRRHRLYPVFHNALWEN